MWARIIVHNCRTQYYVRRIVTVSFLRRVEIFLLTYLQYSTEQFRYFPSYPPDNHHGSDEVYWRREETV